MVNPDSDMFRAHPDWVLKPTANRLPMQGRTQQVVDLTNPDAYAYIYGAMDKLVGELGIDYIKWDHNKYVTEAVSPRTGRPAVHNQTLAVYRIFTDLKAAHPGLEIESCSSGGGRVDLGILEVADRIWGSDCVDPVERADIQRYTSLLVPPEMIGEHVGASPRIPRTAPPPGRCAWPWPSSATWASNGICSRNRRRTSTSSPNGRPNSKSIANGSPSTPRCILTPPIRPCAWTAASCRTRLPRSTASRS